MRLLLCLCFFFTGTFAPISAVAAPAVADHVEELKGQLIVLEMRLASGTLAPAEAVRVRAEIDRIRLLLVESLGRAYTAVRPPKAHPADPAALLRAAAAVPADAAWVFDNSRSTERSVVFAPASASVSGQTPLARAHAAPSEKTEPKALREFLRDIAEYRPSDAISTTLTADDQSHYRLIFERADKSRRIVFGEFLPGTARNGKPGSMSFIVMGAVEVPPGEKHGRTHNGYWREYTGTGRRLEWSDTKETQENYWGPWKTRDELQVVWLAEQSWRDGRWQTMAKEKIKTVLSNPGQSWFSRAERAIMEAPLAGPVLNACNKVAASLYMAMIGTVQLSAAKITGSDIYSLEAGGTFAKSPLLSLFLSDESHIARLTPDARQELYLTVEMNRRRALDAGLYPVPPELRRRVINAPIEAKEAVEALRAGYGSKTYDRRLIHEAGSRNGWSSWTMTGGGIFVGAVENVGEGIFNPMLWSKLGAEKAVAVLKAGGEAAGASLGAKTAYNAARAADAATTAAWVAPWLLNVTDSGGKMVKHTADGKFDKEYFRKLGEAAANAFYMFVMP